MKQTNELIYAAQIKENTTGIHARPAARIVAELTKCKREGLIEDAALYKLEESTDLSKPIKLTGKEPKANCFSILNTIALGVAKNVKFAFWLKGTNCEKAETAIKEILEAEKLI